MFLSSRVSHLGETIGWAATACVTSFRKPQMYTRDECNAEKIEGNPTLRRFFKMVHCCQSNAAKLKTTGDLFCSAFIQTIFIPTEASPEEVQKSICINPKILFIQKEPVDFYKYIY